MLPEIQATFSIEFNFWPVDTPTVIFGSEDGPLSLYLIALPNGTLGIRVTCFGEVEELQGPELQMQGEGDIVFVISVTCSQGVCSIRVNGNELVLVPSGSWAADSFPLQRLARPKMKSISIESYVGDNATDAEALLVRSVHELYEMTIAADWYKLLKASAVLRLLLIDGLCDRANKRHRKTIRFLVLNGDALPFAVDQFWRTLSPGEWSHPSHQVLSRHQFLRTPILKTNDGEITVSDCIEANANAGGGVHFGKPRTDAESLLMGYGERQIHLGHRADRLPLRDIAEVTCRALEPLVHAIQSV